jgi:hypothetical protein
MLGSTLTEAAAQASADYVVQSWAAGLKHIPLWNWGNLACALGYRNVQSAGLGTDALFCHFHACNTAFLYVCSEHRACIECGL